MSTLTVQNYRQADLPRLTEFFAKYLNTYPDAKLNRPEFYTYHPALEEGENVFCVLDGEQHLIGFAPVFPLLAAAEDTQPGPRDIWTVTLASPDLDKADEVRDLLYTAVLNRVAQLKAAFGLSQIRLAADLMDSQKADLDYLLRQGFTSFEEVYVMCRDTTQPIPAISVPAGMTFQLSNLAAAEEQAAYLEVYNACFPELPKTLADLQFLLESFSDTRQVITAYSAAHEFIGSILIYWDTTQGYGVTDDVMVLPHWRGRKVGKALIGEGLKLFRAHGIPAARLEVKASNHAAVAVYTSWGYTVINRESLLGKLI